MVDPWGATNEAVRNLNDTFNNIRIQDRQSRMDDINTQVARQQLAMGDIKLAESQRQADDVTSLRAKLAGAQPTTTTTLTPPRVNAGTPAQMLGVGITPGSKYLDNLPAVAPKASLEADMQAAGLADVPQGPEFSLQQPSASPAVQAYNSGRVQTTTTPPDPFAIAAKYWSDRGEFDKARAVMDAGKAHAEEQGNMAAVGSDNFTNYYTKIAKASLSKTQSDQIEKGLTTIAALAKEGPQYLKLAEPSIQLIPGFEKFSADAVIIDPNKRFVSFDAGNDQKVIVDNQNPKEWKLEKKDPVTDLQIAIKGFDETHPNATAQQRADFVKKHELDMAKAKRQVIVNNPTNNGGGGTLPGGAAGPINEQGVNPAALQGLDPGRQMLIKKIANYEIPIPNSRSKEGIALLSRVSLYDSNFDNQKYPIRQALRVSFTSGPDAKNITSLNTAIHHLDQLDRSSTDLGNRSMPLWNSIANKFEAATGDPKLIKVANDLNAVKGELAATFKGTGATDQEIKAWTGGFSSSSSPAQFKASIQEGVKLLQGRLDALIDKYQTGMGTTKDLQILSPKSIETLRRIGVDVERYKAYAKGGSNGTRASGLTSDAQSGGRPSLDQIFK